MEGKEGMGEENRGKRERTGRGNTLHGSWGWTRLCILRAYRKQNSIRM